jgi:hypothetical protein
MREMKLEKEHLTEHEVAHFRQQGLTQAERLRLDTHVARCEDCLRRILNPAHAHLAFSSLTEAFLPSPDEKPFHLSQEELKRYNNEKMDEADRIIFESHLEICSECKREAVASQAAAGRGAEWTASETKFRLGWLSSFVRWPMLWTPARVFGMIAAVGCVLVVLALWIQKRPVQTQDQAARTEQRNNPTEPAPTGEIAGSDKNVSAPAEADNTDSSNNLSEEREASASSVVSLKDGDVKVSLDRQGTLNGLEMLAPQTQKAVQTALVSEHLSEPQVLNELAGSKIILMGQATDGLPFKLLAPVGIIVNSNRPTLRWQPLDGANLYTVSVFDSDFNRVAKSGAQSATQWSVPLSLQNGKLYSWEVTALKENQEVISPVAPAPRAQFRIVERGNRNEIASVRRAHPRSHLTLGVLYARAGLLAEAEREFRALLKDNPRSNVAKRLLRTVQTWRNR